MPKNNFWLNRAGEFNKFGAAAQRQQYGLTTDVATAPWANQGDYNALISMQQDQLNQTVLDAARTLGESGGEATDAWDQVAPLVAQFSGKHKEIRAALKEGLQTYAAQQQDEAEGGNWFTDAVGSVGSAASWVKDEVEGGIKALPGGDKALTAVDAALTGTYSPIRYGVGGPIQSSIYLSKKANEYGATGITALGVASKQGNLGEQFLDLFHGDTWQDAHNIVVRNHLSVGDTLVGLDYDLSQTVQGNADNHLLADGERLRRMLDNSGTGSAASVAAELAVFWKLDPTVLAGRGAGAFLAVRRGEIVGSAEAQRLQRDIISQGSRADAESIALGAKLSQRRKASRALTLWDQFENIRDTGTQALAGTHPNLSYTDYLNSKAFTRTTNGQVMGSLIAEANEQEWPLLKRWLLMGDEDTHDQLLQGRGEIASKVQAIEQIELKGAQEELDGLLAKRDEINSRREQMAGVPAAPLHMFAPSGSEAEQRLLTTETDWLDEPIEQAQSRVDLVKQKLSSYETHDDWFNRTLAGVQNTGDQMVSAGGRSGAVMSGLDVIGDTSLPTSQRVLGAVTRPNFDRGRSWRDENPTVTSWRHDYFSPESFFLKIPRSWFLKSNHLMNFHETDKSLQSLSGWIDQFETMTGRTDMVRRQAILDDYARLMTEGDKDKFLDRLEEEFATGIGQKYGLNEDMLRMMMAGDPNGGWKGIIASHTTGWRRLTTANLRETEIPQDGSLSSILEWVSNNGLVRAHMPLSVAELKNSRRLLNLQDLDYAIRRHKDILKNMSDSADWRTRLHGKAIAGRRTAADAAFSVMEMFNGIWKPLALISFRWPLRVIGDENTRWAMLGLGGMVREASQGAFNMMYNRGVWAYEKGRKATWARVGQSADDAVGGPPVADAFDVKAVGNPGLQIPLDAAKLDELDPARMDELTARMAQREIIERNQTLKRARAQSYTYAFQAPSEGVPWNTITVNTKDGREVGLLTWDPKTGEVSTTHVAKEFRRQGIASEAFRFANDYAEKHKLRAPEHSETLTDDGSALVAGQGKAPHQQQWDDRILEAEGNNTGFMIDPATDKAMTKGWATSVYPGRMVSLDRPTAQDYRLFVKSNADVLANKRNRVGVWYDHDLDRWVLDVVRPHGKMDSALAEASAAGVDHAFDVSDGMRRYVWEDDPLGNWRPMLKVKGSPKLEKRKSGVGTINVTTLDGKKRQATHIYGPDRLNGNIAIEQARSLNAVEGYFGSGTRMGEQARGAGITGDYRTVQPHERDWADAMSTYVNRYVRKDPIWRRMLNGQSDAQLRGWLRSADGRIYRNRIGGRAVSDPAAHIAEKREWMETHLPTEAVQMALRDSNLDAEAITKLIPEADRKAIQGEKVTQLTGQHYHTQLWNKFVQKMYRYLGSNISDAVTRHPMGAAMYRTKLENLVAQYKDGELTPAIMQGLQAQASNFAIGQIRRYLFNMTDEWNGVRAFRFVAPFFNAQVEVIDRYLKLIGEHPETLGRLMMVRNATGGDHGPFMQTVDENGQPTDDWSASGYVMTQIPNPILKRLGLSKVYQNFPIPTSSVNLIFQGVNSDNPAAYLSPSWGPLVTIPASQWITMRGKPEDRAKWWYKELFPYGQPRDMTDAVLPAWMKRFRTVFFDKGGDPAYGTEVSQAWMSLYADWEKGGRHGAPPSQKQAEHFAEMMYAIRGIAGFVSPVPFNPNPKYQFYIDQYRKLQDEDPDTADKKFYDKYGPEMYRFASSTTTLNLDLPPNALGAQAWQKHRDILQKAPLLAGIIAGPGSQDAEYNYDIYRWQLDQSIAPGSAQTIREKMSPEEILKANNVDRGWLQYNKLMAKVDSQMVKVGLVTLPEIRQKAEEMTGTTNPDALHAAKEALLDTALGSDTPYAAALRTWRDQKLEEIAQFNPGWEDAYRSQSSDMGQFIDQARVVVKDPSMDDRLDIRGLRDYLRIRDAVTQQLDVRQSMGMSGSIAAQENLDLAQWWYTKTRQLVNNNLLFGEIYHRYLERDDLESARY